MDQPNHAGTTTITMPDGRRVRSEGLAGDRFRVSLENADACDLGRHFGPSEVEGGALDRTIAAAIRAAMRAPQPATVLAPAGADDRARWIDALLISHLFLRAATHAMDDVSPRDELQPGWRKAYRQHALRREMLGRVAREVETMALAVAHLVGAEHLGAVREAATEAVAGYLVSEDDPVFGPARRIIECGRRRVGQRYGSHAVRPET